LHLKVPRLPDPNSPEPEVFAEMTLQEHLEELRSRILKIVLAVGLAMIFGFWAAPHVLMQIAEKAGAVGEVDIRSPTDPLTLTFKVGAYIGVAIAMPLIIYQIIAFLAPGLTRKEKRLIYISLPFVSLLFLLGASYAYFVAAPKALWFLKNWNTSVFVWQPDGPELVNFFLTLIIGLGAAFQLPIVMFVLAKIGIISPKKMRAWRKYAIILMLIAAAIITPSTDPFNMAIVAIPLLILYEFGIILSQVFAKTTFRGANAVVADSSTDDV
jgi:sec-independent protein translocase protein TatC